MDPNISLVIPEINAEDIRTITASSLTQTAQLLLAWVPLYPLHKAAGAKRVLLPIRLHQALACLVSQSREEIRWPMLLQVRVTETAPFAYQRQLT